jgi:hypothetical protein
MNTFIFVSIVCIGTNCTFVTSTDAVTQKQCEKVKQEFVTNKFKPEITLAAAQCMKFKERYEL